MRIIFLNSWRGKIWDKYLDFIRKQSTTADVFCLMETCIDVHQKLSKELSNFQNVYEDGGRYEEDGLTYGQSTFIRNNISIISKEKELISEGWVGMILRYNLVSNNKNFAIFNIHGISRPSNKFDTDIRIKQSEKIIQMVQNPSKIILGGDFNLNPDTKSISLIEKSGLKNLISEFKIKCTRNNIAWNNFKDDPGFVKQYFADYCFVSSDVKVKNFEVPYNEVSDHLPLILDFEV